MRNLFEQYMKETFKEPDWDEGYIRGDVEEAFNVGRCSVDTLISKYKENFKRRIKDCKNEEQRLGHRESFKHKMAKSNLSLLVKLEKDLENLKSSKSTTKLESIKYVERMEELLKLGDNINILSRFIHLKQIIREEVK